MFNAQGSGGETQDMPSFIVHDDGQPGPSETDILVFGEESWKILVRTMIEILHVVLWGVAVLAVGFLLSV